MMGWSAIRARRVAERAASPTAGPPTEAPMGPSDSVASLPAASERRAGSCARPCLP
jgi:hypothetical protein